MFYSTWHQIEHAIPNNKKFWSQCPLTDLYQKITSQRVRTRIEKSNSNIILIIMCFFKKKIYNQIFSAAI